jgi:hypothetical protein
LAARFSGSRGPGSKAHEPSIAAVGSTTIRPPVISTRWPSGAGEVGNGLDEDAFRQ